MAGDPRWSSPSCYPKTQNSVIPSATARPDIRAERHFLGGRKPAIEGTQQIWALPLPSSSSSWRYSASNPCSQPQRAVPLDRERKLQAADGKDSERYRRYSHTPIATRSAPTPITRRKTGVAPSGDPPPLKPARLNANIQSQAAPTTTSKPTPARSSATTRSVRPPDRFLTNFDATRSPTVLVYPASF